MLGGEALRPGEHERQVRLRTAGVVRHVADGGQDLRFRLVLVQPEGVLHRRREGGGADLHGVGPDVELVDDVLHELQLLVEVGLALAPGRVQQENNIGFSVFTF